MNPGVAKKTGVTKKIASKPAAAKKPAVAAKAKPAVRPTAGRKLVGKVVHYYDKIGVAVVELKDSLKIGDSIVIESATPVEQKVTSMQIDKKPITQAKAGQAIGLKVSKEVKRNNNVYKVA